MSYVSTCLADSPDLFWELADTTTTAADQTGNGRTGTYTGGYTQSITGPSGVGVNGTTFNGSTGYVFLNTSVSSHTIFTIETWFLTSTAGHGIGGFSAGQGTNATQDREIYLDSSGNFGSYTFNSVAGQNTITSGTNYADGNWHYGAITMSNTAGAMDVYVDGVKTTGSPMTPSASYTGFWLAGLIGGTGTNGGPTLSTFFNGSLCCFAIYPTALTSTQIGNHYAAGAPPTSTYSGQPLVVPSLAATQAANW